MTLVSPFWVDLAAQVQDLSLSLPLATTPLLAESSDRSAEFPVVGMIIMFGVTVLAIIGSWYCIRERRRAKYVATEEPDYTAKVRDTLFGDIPLNEFAKNADAPPRSHFTEARRLLLAGKKEEAAAAFRKVLETPDLESRFYLQAWHFLRPLGHKPEPEEALRVLGIVIEVYLPEGLDLLAAYADRSARYYSHSGAGAVWEHADTSLDADIDRLLSASATIVQQLGAGDNSRPSPPPRNQMRMTFLTPAGISYGQGPEAELAANPDAREVLAAASNLINKLMEKANP